MTPRWCRARPRTSTPWPACTRAVATGARWPPGTRTSSNAASPWAWAATWGDDASFLAALAAVRPDLAGDVASLLGRARVLASSKPEASALLALARDVDDHREPLGRAGRGRPGTMARVSTTADLRDAFHGAVGRAVVGQRQAIDGLLLTILVGGHVLIEGVPGRPRR